MDEARAKLLDVMLTPSSKGPKASKLELAEELARKAGHEVVYPLTVDTVLDVAASLKAADYGSGHFYLVELRARHQDLGFDLGSAMIRLFDRCKASIERGLGGPVRAGVFDMGCFKDEAMSENQDDRALVLSTWFLNREIETSFARLAHAVFKDDRVVWSLPVSKNDVAGTGAARSWPCLCGKDFGPALGTVTFRVCPFCTMVRQVTYT